MPSSPAGPAAPAGGPVGSSAEVTVPLRTVLDRADLGVRAVVAPEGAGVELRDVAVRWAHPSEVRDPVPYLLGSELLLTAGQDVDEVHVRHYSVTHTIASRTRSTGVRAVDEPQQRLGAQARLPTPTRS